MNIHLVAVEVSVERRANALIKPQSSSLRNFNLEAHHADTMQARLTIENNYVTISKMSFHYIAVL